MQLRARRAARSAVLVLALILPTCCFGQRSPRLRLSAVSDVDMDPLLVTTRQNTDKGVCSTKQNEIFCPKLCCPGRCCPYTFPFCLSTDSSTTAFCVDVDGKIRCSSGRLGTPCVAALGRGFDVCCPVVPYDRCTVDEPFYCVTEDGYIGCGADNQPGVACLDGGCCLNPTRCCDGGCCDDGGEGSARKVEALIVPQAAKTPLPPGTSLSPTASLQLPMPSLSSSLASTPSPSRSPTTSPSPSSSRSLMPSPTP